jgi:hypothetical protein
MYYQGKSRKLSFLQTPPLFFGFLLVVLLGLSSLWSIEPLETLKIFISTIVTFVCAVYLIGAMPHISAKSIDIIVRLLLGSILCIALIFSYHLLFDTMHANGHSILYISPVKLKPSASILGLSFFVISGFLFLRYGKIFSLLTFVLFVLFIYVSLCQTALFSMFFASMAFIFSYFFPFWSTRIAIVCSYTYIILSPLLFFHIIPASSFYQNNLLEKFMTSSLYHRFLAWEFYTEKFFEQPLTGWGAASSKYLQEEDGLAENFSNVIHPHSASIQAYLEFGLAGGILLALFFASLFWMVEKHVKDRLAVAVCNATLTFAFVAAVVTHNMWHNYWLSLSALVACLALIFVRIREGQLHASVDHSRQGLSLQME